MAYAALSDLKTYLGISVTTDDTLLTALLTRAQQQIDSYCRRWFEAKTQTRYYREEAVRVDGDDPWRDLKYDVINPVGEVLYLDEDLLSVTTLTNGDGTTLAASAYWLEPRNAGPPYWYIRLKSAYSWAFSTDGEIAVAGTWGYSTTAPADIVQATLRMAAFLYRQKDAQVFDVTAFTESGILTVPKGLPDDVKQILEPYRRAL